MVELSVFKGMRTPYLYSARSYKRRDTPSITPKSSEMRRISVESNGLTFDQLPSLVTELSFNNQTKG